MDECQRKFLILYVLGALTKPSEHAVFQANFCHYIRLGNYLYCVRWGFVLYSLTLPRICSEPNSNCLETALIASLVTVLQQSFTIFDAALF